jgi:hypothetical protein
MEIKISGSQLYAACVHKAMFIRLPFPHVLQEKHSCASVFGEGGGCFYTMLFETV